MSNKAISDLWWKNAIVYCVDVEFFQDSDGDGVGDLPGLTSRIDYLAGLGVTCLWLMPFYPTPNKDNGYDISDYYGIDPRLGTLGDFVEMARTARERGIRVILDLVVNHTSEDHPWFQAARADEHSPYRDYYVWADERPEDGPPGIVFPDAETSNWDYDEVAGKWYLHRFYRHMPDLNIANPRVRDEIHKVIGFWLELGVSGFRVDAAPFVIEMTGEEDGPVEQPEDPHDFLRDLREFLNRRRGDAILLAEAALPMEEQRRFFGDERGDEMHMLFDFISNQKLFLSLVREDARPLAESIRELPLPAEQSQWATFVKNHDELSLERLTDDERAEVLDALAPEKSMRLFDRGIRRRLPTMLGGDQRRMRLIYSLLLTLPGTPVLLYGEEIGLADNPDIEGRGAIRVPMQWAPAPGAGFTTDPARVVVPLVTGEFGPERVNAETQRHDPGSLLNWMERHVRLRKELPELGWGHCEVLDAGDPAVLAHRCDWQGRTMVVLHNLARTARTVTLDLDAPGRVVELASDQQYRPPDDGRTFRLEGSGFRWLRLERDGRS